MRAIELIRTNIDRVLTKKKWSGHNLAQALGVSDSHVSQIRTGKRWNRRIEWATYRKICEALEIDELRLIKPLPCANEELASRLAEGVADLKDKDDVALVFQFLAILKHKDILTPIHFGVLTGSMSMLQEELLRKRGPEAFLKPVEPQATALEEKLNQEMRN